MARRTGAVLLVGTILGGWSVPLLAQDAAPVAIPPATQPARVQAVTPGTIR